MWPTPPFSIVAIASDSFSRFVRSFIVFVKLRVLRMYIYVRCAQHFRKIHFGYSQHATASFQCNASLLCFNCSVIAGATGARNLAFCLKRSAFCGAILFISTTDIHAAVAVAATAAHFLNDYHQNL